MPQGDYERRRQDDRTRRGDTPRPPLHRRRTSESSYTSVESSRPPCPPPSYRSHRTSNAPTTNSTCKRPPPPSRPRLSRTVSHPNYDVIRHGMDTFKIGLYEHTCVNRCMSYYTFYFYGVEGKMVLAYGPTCSSGEALREYKRSKTPSIKLRSFTEVCQEPECFKPIDADRITSQCVKNDYSKYSWCIRGVPRDEWGKLRARGDYDPKVFYAHDLQDVGTTAWFDTIDDIQERNARRLAGHLGEPSPTPRATERRSNVRSDPGPGRARGADGMSVRSSPTERTVKGLRSEIHILSSLNESSHRSINTGLASLRKQKELIDIFERTFRGLPFTSSQAAWSGARRLLKSLKTQMEDTQETLEQTREWRSGVPRSSRMAGVSYLRPPLGRTSSEWTPRQSRPTVRHYERPRTRRRSHPPRNLLTTLVDVTMDVFHDIL